MTKGTFERLVGVLEELLEDGTLAAAGRRQTLGPDVPLDAIAGDSVARIMLLEAIEDEFDLRLAERKLRGLRTLGDLTALLDRELAAVR